MPANIKSLYRRYFKSSNKSLFIKIFITFTLVCSFLILMLGFYTYYYVLHNLNLEIEKLEKKKLTETLSMANTLFGEMRKITISYALNSSFTQFAYLSREDAADKYTEIRKNQDILSSTVNSSSYIENIFIYYKANDYIIDNSGVIDTDAFYDHGWMNSYDNLSTTSKILDTRKVKKRANENAYNNIITFITRIPYTGSPKEGLVVLNVDSGIISDLLKNITSGDKDALAFIVNSEGMILASSDNLSLYDNLSKVLDFSRLMDSPNNEKLAFTINNKKMVSYMQDANINDWKLFYTVPESTVYKNSIIIRNITVLTCILLLVFMTVISLLFSFKLYNPIRKIMLNIQSMLNISSESENDITTIQSSLYQLFNNTKNMEEQLNHNKVLMSELFLKSLISGKLFNIGEIKNKADYFQINLDGDYFRVAVIQNNTNRMEPSSIEDLELKKITLLNIVQTVFKNMNINVYYSQEENDNILILVTLIAGDEPNERDGIVEYAIEDVKENIDRYLGFHISIGLGRSYRNLSDLSISYKEALEALQFKFLKGDDSVIKINEINNQGKEQLYYPIDKEQMLISLVKLSDYEKVVRCLIDMLNDISDHNKSFEHIEICLSNIIGVIQRCIYEMNLTMKDVFIEDDQLNISINEFTNLQQFTEWVCSKFRQIIDFQTGLEKIDAKGFSNEIRNYIDKYYSDEISLASIASHFNYNTSYFSKIFKEKLGTSFWDYVAKYRIEKSKKILSETNLSIEQIASMVGYNNRFSYIRTFKKFLHIAPGEYRRKNKNSTVL